MRVLLVNTLQTEPITGAQSYMDLTQPLGPGTNSCSGEGGKGGVGRQGSKKRYETVWEVDFHTAFLLLKVRLF